MIGAIAVLSMIVQWNDGSVWSELSVIFVSLPSMVISGLLATRRGPTRPGATA